MQLFRGWLISLFSGFTIAYIYLQTLGQRAQALFPSRFSGSPSDRSGPFPLARFEDQEGSFWKTGSRAGVAETGSPRSSESPHQHLRTSISVGVTVEMTVEMTVRGTDCPGRRLSASIAQSRRQSRRCFTLSRASSNLRFSSSVPAISGGTCAGFLSSSRATKVR